MTLKPVSFLQVNKQDLDSTVQHSNMWQWSVGTLKMLFDKGNISNAVVLYFESGYDLVLKEN